MIIVLFHYFITSCYYDCMKLHQYISLNIFSFITYLILTLIIFVFVIQTKINLLFISLEGFFSIYSFLMYFSLLLILLLIIEKFIYKKYPKKKFQIKIKSEDLKKIYLFLFVFGFYLALFNLIVFILAYIFLIKL